MRVLFLVAGEEREVEIPFSFAWGVAVLGDKGRRECACAKLISLIEFLTSANCNPNPSFSPPRRAGPLDDHLFCRRPYASWMSQTSRSTWTDPRRQPRQQRTPPGQRRRSPSARASTSARSGSSRCASPRSLTTLLLLRAFGRLTPSSYCLGSGTQVLARAVGAGRGKGQAPRHNEGLRAVRPPNARHS